MPARLRCRARRPYAAGLFRRYRMTGRGKQTQPVLKGKADSPAHAPMTRHMEGFDGKSKAIFAAVQQISRYCAAAAPASCSNFSTVFQLRAVLPTPMPLSNFTASFEVPKP